MSTEHLGERLSALVDGELGPAEHERALIHLAKCEPCRVEADMMRRLKRRLTGLCEPEPDMDFLGRLSGLSRGPASDGRGPFDPPPGGWGFGDRPPLGTSRPIGGYPMGGSLGPLTADAAPMPPPPSADASRPSRPDAQDRPARRRGGERLAQFFPLFPGGRYAVAGLAVATALLGTAFVAGGDSEDTPVVRPRLNDYAVEHAVTSRQTPVPQANPAGAPAETSAPEATR